MTGSDMTEAEGESKIDTFEREYKVMSLFIDNAKTYTQLSIGALVLSITSVREVLALPKEQPIQLDWPLLTCWVCFLLAVIFGALYQYLACKFVEEKAKVQRSHRIRWGWIISHPWPVYGVMLVTFYGGAISFTVGAILRLPYR
jgi:hypothetical protein